MKVFVYGTLLKGMSRYEILADSHFIGHATTKGVLYDLGAFPAIRQGNSVVYGELYEVSEEKLGILDGIEGYSPEDEHHSLYVRKEVNVKLLSDGSQEKAFAYFYNRDLEDHKIIDCGDYRKYRLEASSDTQWYIAYGSNMSSERLKARIGKSHEIKTGYLEGYKLMFNKKADKRGSYANLAYIGPGCRCPFAAYSISTEQLYKLDKYEGEPSHYVRIGLQFSAEKGESYIGHVYIANPDKLTENQNPSSDYLKYIYKGYEEHGFDRGGLQK